MNIFLLMINAFCGTYCIYCTAILLFGLLRKCPGNPHAKAGKRIAAVIAARNEEDVIHASVSTLLGQKYPRELMDVWVIPNNCTDGTAAAAERAGARVLECSVPVKCKGDVLSFAFGELMKKENYDAFCVFDADNLIDPGFFQAANNALCAGARIAQGYRDSKNPTESWVSGSMSVYFWFMSRFFNPCRRALGLSAMLSGTGFVVSTDLLRENGWDTYTLTEDLEYTAQRGLLGEKIGWMKDAVIYDEQPVLFRDSFEQRRRWFAGTLQIVHRYSLRLWKSALGGSLQALDFAVFFTGALTQFIGLIPLPFTLYKLGSNLYRYGGWFLPVITVLMAVSGFCIACSLAAWGICRLVRQPAKSMLSTILMIGPFLISWVFANVFSLFRRDGWNPIVHTSNANLEIIAAAREGKSSAK